MEVKKTNLTKSELLNILKGMNSVDLDVVTHDTLHFKCNHCHGCLPFGSNRIQEICNTLNKDIGSVLKDLMKGFIGSHYHQGNICKGFMEVDEMKTPEHLLLVFPESDLKYLTDFPFSDRIYKPILSVVGASNEMAIFALYQRQDVEYLKFKDFISCNLYSSEGAESLLAEEEAVFDDDSFNSNRACYVKMTGGGRRLASEKNYICQWCPESVTRRGMKGVFNEYKCYKKHFVVFHHEKEGIPMDDFYQNVVRADPKWLCPKCENLYSMVNAARHYGIVHPQHDGQNRETSSSSEEEHSNARESSSENRPPELTHKETKEAMPSTSKDKRSLEEIESNVVE